MKKRFIIMLVICFIATAFCSNAVFADYYSQNQTLYKGMSGTEVSNLQGDLKTLGYFSYNMTGYFGELTAQSVMLFQKSNGLVVDGIVGHGTAREIKVGKVLKTAKQYQGVPYVWGGSTPSGFDCSGFTQYSFAQNNVTLPRTAAQQFQVGTWVSKDQLKRGDLLFFDINGSGVSHVGIYLGGGQMIHASSGANSVKIADFNISYFQQRYIGAKRIIN